MLRPKWSAPSKEIRLELRLTSGEDAPDGWREPRDAETERTSKPRGRCASWICRFSTSRRCRTCAGLGLGEGQGQDEGQGQGQEYAAMHSCVAVLRHGRCPSITQGDNCQDNASHSVLAARLHLWPCPECESESEHPLRQSHRDLQLKQLIAGAIYSLIPREHCSFSWILRARAPPTLRAAAMPSARSESGSRRSLNGTTSGSAMFRPITESAAVLLPSKCVRHSSYSACDHMRDLTRCNASGMVPACGWPLLLCCKAMLRASQLPISELTVG